MARKKQASWQFKFTMALSILMFFLIFGYFRESFLEIRKVKPVSVAIERLNAPVASTPTTSETEPKSNIKTDNVENNLPVE
jgi:outer membrane biosynthesis protein TonB